MLFRRMELLLEGAVPAAALFSGPVLPRARIFDV